MKDYSYRRLETWGHVDRIKSFYKVPHKVNKQNESICDWGNLNKCGIRTG